VVSPKTQNAASPIELRESEFKEDLGGLGMSVYFSTDHFPVTPVVKDQAGVPWGAVLQPLDDLPAQCITKVSTEDVPRCTSCFAYINPYSFKNFQNFCF